MTQRWLLPEQIEDLLPPEAWRLESARRALIDLFRGHGYELVAPPALEYMESLLTGAGEAADLVTFKVVDQLSGRLLGLRADITPQVARIDAHRLDRSGISRLCYAGHVYHAQVRGAGKSREPYQIGAELYGHAGLAADLEVQGLLFEALGLLRLEGFVFDLGHVGIFRTLTEDLPVALEAELVEALQGRNAPRIDALTSSLPLTQRAALRALPMLCGGIDVIARARAQLPAMPGIVQALDALGQAAAALAQRGRIEIDLAELRGYAYHSGMIFAAYTRGFPEAVARGGRYDDIGVAFGRARPATGFSIDLLDLLPGLPVPVHGPIAWLSAETALALAPADLDRALRTLRAAGVVVVRELEGGDGMLDPRCDHTLEAVDERLEITTLNPD